MQPVGRSSGRSAVAAAAYRTGEKLTNERDGEIHDYTRRGGVAHTEIVLPQGVDAEWAQDRSVLWNAAEAAEKRCDARVAREFEVSLPHELNPEQRLAAARELAQHLADRYGVAVDVAIHEPHRKSDERNHHAHLLMTTRAVTPDGLGEKTDIERENKWLMPRGLPTSHQQLRDVREQWGGIANRHLAMAGLEMRIDHRSHEDRGLSIAPTQHMGVHASQMQRRGLAVERTALEVETAQRNAELIAANPAEVLTILTAEKSVFDRRDIARTLHRYTEGVADFERAYASVMASDALVPMQAEQTLTTGEVIPARYSTQEMVAIEGVMEVSATRMDRERGKAVPADQVARALADKPDRPSLSAEQRVAVEHVTGLDGGGRIAAVVGLAGAGKSTMLGAAREAWEGAGLRVVGAALSGKAADGLQASSGIESRTLASWEYGWKRDQAPLGPRDVLVIDEAGMVSSRQLANFVAHADKAGAKLVLVGDPEQLQPINAGAAFRALAERIGVVSLEEVRRQHQGWMREASAAFGQHRTREALDAYEERGRVRGYESPKEARAQLVSDYLFDREIQHLEPGWGSRIALAHRRVDVRQLNDEIREGLAAQGELSNPQTYQTETGERSFAVGDRMVFLRNDPGLGVKNGTLATVEQVAPGTLGVRLDGHSPDKPGARVTVNLKSYKDIDHGYATTIHKSQGATVDRTFVLGSASMDRHLTYVAMTRHRQTVTMYYDRGTFPEYEQLAERLSRSNAKETTLDYAEGGRSAVRGDTAGQQAEQQARNKAPIDPVRAQVEVLRDVVDRFGARRSIDVGKYLEVAAQKLYALLREAKDRLEAFRARGEKAAKAEPRDVTPSMATPSEENVQEKARTLDEIKARAGNTFAPSEEQPARTAKRATRAKTSDKAREASREPERSAEDASVMARAPADPSVSSKRSGRRAFDGLRSAPGASSGARSKPAHRAARDDGRPEAGSTPAQAEPGAASTSVERLATHQALGMFLTQFVDRMEDVRDRQREKLPELAGDNQRAQDLLGAIEKIKPGSMHMIESVNKQDPGFLDQIAKEHVGPARGVALWNRMTQEYLAQKNPEVMHERAQKAQREERQKQVIDRDQDLGLSR